MIRIYGNWVYLIIKNHHKIWAYYFVIYFLWSRTEFCFLFSWEYQDWKMISWKMRKVWHVLCKGEGREYMIENGILAVHEGLLSSKFWFESSKRQNVWGKVRCGKIKGLFSRVEKRGVSAKEKEVPEEKVG